MDKQTNGFRFDSEQTDELALDRWHLQQIKAGLRDALANKTRPNAEVRQLVSLWRIR